MQIVLHTLAEKREAIQQMGDVLSQCCKVQARFEFICEVNVIRLLDFSCYAKGSQLDFKMTNTKQLVKTKFFFSQLLHD